MNSVDEVVTYLLQVGAVTLVQLFTLGGPLLVLISILSWLSGNVRRLAVDAIGLPLYHFIFGWFGTAMHEIGHLLAALLFGYHVSSVRLFKLNPYARTRGFVESGHNAGNLLQHLGTFFLGVAPLIFGPLLIFISCYFLFFDEIDRFMRSVYFDIETTQSLIGAVFRSSFAFLSFLFSSSHFIDWRLYVFLYIAFSVGSSVRLSDEDIGVAIPGCITFISVLFLFNLVLFSIGVSSAAMFAWLLPYYAFFYAILIFVMLLDLLAIVILWLPAAIRRSARK